MTVEQIAEVAHEANRAFCRALGDHSQTWWGKAPDWQRDPAIAGVKFKLANPGATHEDMHKEWLAAKIADGWTYGPIKNPALKQHPCCCKYEDLPIEQRIKDSLFSHVVEARSSACCVKTTTSRAGSANFLAALEKDCPHNQAKTMNSTPTPSRPFNPDEYKKAVEAGFASGLLSMKPVSVEDAIFVKRALEAHNRTERYRLSLKNDPKKAAKEKRDQHEFYIRRKEAGNDDTRPAV